MTAHNYPHTSWKHYSSLASSHLTLPSFLGLPTSHSAPHRTLPFSYMPNDLVITSRPIIITHLTSSHIEGINPPGFYHALIQPHIHDKPLICSRSHLSFDNKLGLQPPSLEETFFTTSRQYQFRRKLSPKAIMKITSPLETLGNYLAPFLPHMGRYHALPMADGSFTNNNPFGSPCAHLHGPLVFQIPSVSTTTQPNQQQHCPLPRHLSLLPFPSPLLSFTVASIQSSLPSHQSHKSFSKPIHYEPHHFYHLFQNFSSSVSPNRLRNSSSITLPLKQLRSHMLLPHEASPALTR